MQHKTITKLLILVAIFLSIGLLTQYIFILRPESIEVSRINKIRKAEDNFNACLSKAVEEYDKLIENICLAKEGDVKCDLSKTVNQKLESSYKDDKNKCMVNYKLEINSIQ